MWICKNHIWNVEIRGCNSRDGVVLSSGHVMLAAETKHQTIRIIHANIIIVIFVFLFFYLPLVLDSQRLRNYLKKL